MKTKNISGICLSFVLVLLSAVSLAWPALATAQNLILTNLVVDNQAGDITVRFGLEVDNTEPVRRALRGGESLGLRCRAVLYRQRSVLPDAVVVQNDLLHTLAWNGLTREYSVTLPGREEIKGQVLDTVLKSAWGEMSLDLGPWDVLVRGKEYTLDLSVAMDRVDVPDWLRKTLFFWSWDVVPEARYRLDFRY